MRIVLALGGNALLERGEPPEADVQERHVREAACAIAPLAAHHQLVVTHGNGPQIGLLALESARDPDLSHPYPFDALGAQSQGMIGYWLAQHLEDVGAGTVACLVTRTLVDRADPAFAEPTKFVGAVYDEEAARALTAERGWQMRPDGVRWRRVVASPRPRAVLELPLVRRLLDDGVLVVCGGGGGVPVARAPGGVLGGVEAVVDKDRTAALLAVGLEADALVLLTDVNGVVAGYGTDDARLLRRIGPAELRGMDLPAGSMGPKAEAACDFVEATGRPSFIGALDQAPAVLAGHAGTAVRPPAAPPR